MRLPSGWESVLREEAQCPGFRELEEFLARERAGRVVYPEESQTFAALELTPYQAVRAVILGQDPYHDEGQAHGLCFSVPPGTRPPPSLMNIFKELKSDLGVEPPAGGCLSGWARQGVLLLNAVLTVRAHEPGSHKDRGWEIFTDAIIEKVSQKPTPVVFVLWGAAARKKKSLIDLNRHEVIESAHPSPLSAFGGFFGSRPFSRVNAALIRHGQPPIDWSV